MGEIHVGDRFGGDKVMGDKHVGDNFSNIGSGATVINKSVVSNSLNRVQSAHGEDVALALERIGEIVAASQNAEAIENFNELSEQLATAEPKKAVLRSLWAGICAALPAVSELSALGERIVVLFR
ncbi:hypothetical protein [Streptomyces liangshanensis]|uniref:hypothetical protein n=1 Tax=Streptomyces liangshanensis TaxID=2717324 RepID=UPI0036DAC5EC